MKKSKKYCSKQCKEFCAICDFCYYYDFNPNKGGAYIELGYCRLRFEAKDPADGCPKFVCAAVKEKEPIRLPHMAIKKSAKKEGAK